MSGYSRVSLQLPLTRLLSALPPLSCLTSTSCRLAALNPFMPRPPNWTQDC